MLGAVLASQRGGIGVKGPTRTTFQSRLKCAIWKQRGRSKYHTQQQHENLWRGAWQKQWKARKWIACPSGLGLLAVRLLLSYSAKPTANALSWFRHLLWYLKGAEEHGVWFEENEQGAVAADRRPVEAAFRNRERSSEVMVEVFSDSNWAGCVSRKSTTSRCICRWKPGAKQLQEADEPSIEFMWGTFGSVEFSFWDQAGDKFGEILHERWGW